MASTSYLRKLLNFICEKINKWLVCEPEISSFQRITLISSKPADAQYFLDEASLFFPENTWRIDDVNICPCTEQVATIGSNQIGHPHTGGEKDSGGGSHTDYYVDLSIYENNIFKDCFDVFDKAIVKCETKPRNKDINVFILDTGIDQHLIDLVQARSIQCEIMPHTCLPSPSSSKNHGTVVTAEFIVALEHRNNVIIHDYNVSEITQDGKTVITASKVACALQDILLNKEADDIIYINMSFGFKHTNDIVRKLLIDIMNKFNDVHIFCSAGNDGLNLNLTNNVNFPSNISQATSSLITNKFFEIYGLMNSSEGPIPWTYTNQFSTNYRDSISVGPHWHDAVIFTNPGGTNAGGTSISCPRALAKHINDLQ